MKKQIYIVEIDMPDGDLVSSGWLQDLIQQDLDSEEDKNRQVVFVREISLPSGLDEAAQKVEDYYDVGEGHGCLCCHRGDIKGAFKAGAEWMAGKWETIDGEITTTSDNGWEIIRIPNKLYPLGTKVTVQIRKK